jgi:hypothetical protein
VVGKPLPLVVVDSGSAAQAPSGSMPIGLYGAGSGGGESGVSSVNGKTGDVVLNAASVGATTNAQVDTKIAAINFPVKTVNSKAGDVVLDAESVGAVKSSNGNSLIYYNNSSGVQSTLPIDYSKNYTGQIRADYTTLSVTNLAPNVRKVFTIASGTPTVAPSPVTTYPIDGVQSYNPGLYDQTADRLKENPIPGQVHEWRIVGTFANKEFTNTGAVYLEFFNPDSTFLLSSNIPLQSGVTTGRFSILFKTVADSNSIASGKGYQLGVLPAFNDPDFTVNILSILRVSSPIENLPRGAV